MIVLKFYIFFRRWKDEWFSSKKRVKAYLVRLLRKLSWSGLRPQNEPVESLKKQHHLQENNPDWFNRVLTVVLAGWQLSSTLVVLYVRLIISYDIVTLFNDRIALKKCLSRKPVSMKSIPWTIANHDKGKGMLGRHRILIFWAYFSLKKTTVFPTQNCVGIFIHFFFQWTIKKMIENYPILLGVNYIFRRIT